jgi:hypothetical protein
VVSPTMLCEHFHGSVLWPYTALLLHFVFRVVVQDGSTFHLQVTYYNCIFQDFQDFLSFHNQNKD